MKGSDIVLEVILVRKMRHVSLLIKQESRELFNSQRNEFFQLQGEGNRPPCNFLPLNN